MKVEAKSTGKVQIPVREVVPSEADRSKTHANVKKCTEGGTVVITT